MRHNRSESVANQGLRATRNQWLTNPYNTRDNKRHNKSIMSSPVIIISSIILVVLFAEPVINNVLYYMGV